MNPGKMVVQLSRDVVEELHRRKGDSAKTIEAVIRSLLGLPIPNDARKRYAYTKLAVGESSLERMQAPGCERVRLAVKAYAAKTGARYRVEPLMRSGDWYSKVTRVE